MNGFLWMIVAAQSALVAPPTIDAKSAVVMDEQSGIVLFKKDPDTPRPPASTTKVMTGLLLIENVPLDEEVTVPKSVAGVRWYSSMNLKPGEKLTAGDLLHGIMLRSANDGSYAAAVHVSGSVSDFAKRMTERARAIGALNATFKNPHGLQEAGHRMSARDLALISREAMKLEIFRDVVKKISAPIKRSINQKDLLMGNRNRYLKQDPTADGIKTGFTTPAGQCYAGSATRNGYRIITSLLKSENHRKDHAALLDWAYANWQPYTMHQKGDLLGTMDLVDGRKVEALAANDVRAMSFITGLKPMILQVVRQPIREDKDGQKIIGYAVAGYPNGERFRIPVTEGATITTPIAIAGTQSPTGVLLGGMLLGGAMLLRRKSRRTETLHAKPETTFLG